MRLLAYSGLWTQLGYGYWAVEEKASGRYVGELGFADFKRDSVPGVGGVPELGWALMKQVHGKGYATEGLLAATAWGDAQFGAARTFCIIQSANTASIRVAEKVGYREIHRKDAEGETEIHFARDPWGVAFSRLCPGSF